MDRETVVDEATLLGREFERGWTEEGIAWLRKSSASAELSSRTHARCAALFNALFRTTGAINIMTAASATALASATTGGGCESSQQTELTILTVLSTATVVLAGMISFYGWNVRSVLHNIVSNEYANVALDLGEQLSLPLHARDDMHLVLERTSGKFKELAMRSPLVPAWMARRCKNASESS